MIRPFRVVLAVLPLLVLLAWASPLGQGDCSGSTVHEDNGLTCTGACDPSTQTCAPKEKTGNIIGFTNVLYQYCACDEGAEPSCCHLVARKNGAGKWVPAHNGNCPSCPLNGSCQLKNAQAVCEVLPDE